MRIIKSTNEEKTSTLLPMVASEAVAMTQLPAGMDMESLAGLIPEGYDAEAELKKLQSMKRAPRSMEEAVEKGEKYLAEYRKISDKLGELSLFSLLPMMKDAMGGDPEKMMDPKTMSPTMRSIIYWGKVLNNWQPVSPQVVSAYALFSALKGECAKLKTGVAKLPQYSEAESQKATHKSAVFDTIDKALDAGEDVTDAVYKLLNSDQKLRRYETERYAAYIKWQWDQIFPDIEGHIFSADQVQRMAVKMHFGLKGDLVPSAPTLLTDTPQVGEMLKNMPVDGALDELDLSGETPME